MRRLLWLFATKGQREQRCFLNKNQRFLLRSSISVLGQALTHIIVNLVIGLVIAVLGREDQQCEDHEEYREHLRHALGKLTHIGDQGAEMSARLS